MRDDTQAGVILLDVASGKGEFDRTLLERLGHPVTVCNGPEVAHLCPLLGGKGCDKFEHAHGVVFELDLDRAQHRRILERYRELGGPAMPIRAVVSDEQAARFRDLLADIETWPSEPSVADLDGFAAEVEAADRYA